MKKSLTIGWLYPELMSTYGDRGNIIVLQKRCEWRGIGVEVLNLDVGFDHKLLAKCNMLFMGGAQDQQQTIVTKDLRSKKQELRNMIEDGIPTLLICGAYQFLGNYYKEADGTVIPGLGILDLHTVNPGSERLIGNLSARLCHSEQSEESSLMFTNEDSSAKPQNDMSQTLVGFENHGGRTYLGEKVRPLAKVIKGFGNNGKDDTEGAVYKNTFGTYMHGPILPKNPEFADLLIKLALEKKNGTHIPLKQLNDEIENKAREAILSRL